MTQGMRRQLMIGGALFVVTLAVFAQVRRFDFINVDDPQYIRDNSMVRAGLTARGAHWAFTTFTASNWHPLTWLSHMADVEMFGLESGGHHLTSAVIHSLNAALLFFVLAFLTQSTWRSAIVAALFALHPLRMESVAWVSERKDVLCAMFFLLAIFCHARFVRSGGRVTWYAATLGAFAMALMSKPMAVTLPCVLLLLDVWPLNRPIQWRLIWEKVPLFLLSATSATVTLIAQGQGGATSEATGTQALRLGNAIWSVGRYLRKTVWPFDLAANYPYLGMVPGTQLPISGVLWSASVVVVISVFAWLMWRRERAILVGWLWFLGMLVPVIGVIQVGEQSMADRYSYLPHIGLFIAAVWGFAAIARAKQAGAVLGLGAAFLLAASTAYQLRYWQNSGTLFQRALQVTDHNAPAEMCLAMWLVEQKQPDAAMEHFNEAVKIDPQDFQIHMNLGSLLLEQGRAKEAIPHLEFAARAQPNRAVVQTNYANALADLGRIDEAVASYQRAIKLDPGLAQAWYNYGVTLAKVGRLRDASPPLAEALRLRPDYPEARYAYALALEAQHDDLAAATQLDAALRIRPRWPEALNRLARILATSADDRLRNGNAAAGLALEACRLTKMGNGMYLDTLAAAYAELGRFDDAQLAAAQALELARAANQPRAAQEIADRLELYRAHKPFRKAPATTSPSMP